MSKVLVSGTAMWSAMWYLKRIGQEVLSLLEIWGEEGEEVFKQTWGLGWSSHAHTNAVQSTDSRPCTAQNRTEQHMGMAASRS